MGKWQDEETKNNAKKHKREEERKRIIEEIEGMGYEKLNYSTKTSWYFINDKDEVIRVDKNGEITHM